jgi:GxxExxY protein
MGRWKSLEFTNVVSTFGVFSSAGSILDKYYNIYFLYYMMDENELGTVVLKHAYEIHTELGPGLMESVYEAVLAYEIRLRGIEVQRQSAIPIYYRDVKFEEGFRADLIVGKKVMLELKSVENLEKVHAKKLLTQLRLSGIRLGYLINFGAAHLKHGIKRVVNGLSEASRFDY